ncbi:MAG: DUF1207 domain-containing protein [Bacteroidetes bacterium]|nr:DUF1207 domain-containing protein [Bacteroidota bacterium]
MKAISILLAILFVSPAGLHSQHDSDFSRTEGRLLFPPLIAHHVEPRVGMSRLLGEERLRLDIGNSIDVLQWAIYNDEMQVAIGADFFTWTSLRQEKDFHFPVDAVDYLFGVNASFARTLSDRFSAALRLRLSHISAHLVDGSYQKESGTWRDGQLPRVYSREYVDLIAAVEWSGLLRLYGGGQYIYHIDPATLGKWSLQSGIEAVWQGAGAGWLHPYAAVDLRLIDIDGWEAAVNLQVGVKAGCWRGTGVQLYIAWFRGKSQHGEYYDQNWSYWGPGFNIDF